MPDDSNANPVPVTEFHPVCALELDEHVPVLPRYPLINVHTHTSLKLAKPADVQARMLKRFGAALGENATARDFLRNVASTGDSIEAVIRTMDECHVERQVDLDGLLPTPEHLDLYGPYRDRFILFHVLSLDGWEQRGYDARLAAGLEQAVEQGARGLKMHKTLGLTARDSRGRVVPIDDPRFDPVWAKAGELAVPVLMHCADPNVYFMPVDGANPAYKKLYARPERSYHGPQFPAKDQILEQRNNVIARHPKTIFIGPHHGNCAENLKAVGELLDRHENFVVEFSYALVPLGLQPATTRRHFIRYQDRIMFGTDGLPDVERYRMYFRWLETDDDYFECGNGAWIDRIYGLKLPAAVLRKIYRTNALRLFPKSA